MTHPSDHRDGSPHPTLSPRAFIALVAALMGINALAVDSMLPALPEIARALDITEPNHRQWIIFAYLLGFGFAQLFFGPLSDRFGRRPVLLIGLGLFALMCFTAAFATSFEMMIAARVLQGVAAASTRVLAVSIVRDCYSGRAMARVMSLIMMIFLIVPILAPNLGQLILLVGPWPWIFVALGLIGGTILVFAALHLPETLHPDHKSAISVRNITRAWGRVLGERASVGYTLASTLLFGGTFSFIASSQQIFGEVFGKPELFTLIFAGCAGTMGVASYANSRIVEQLGTRQVSHTALIAFVVVAAIHLAVALYGVETIWTFSVLQAAMLGGIALSSANFSSIAMQPLAGVAGTAASIQGFTTTVGGTLLGSVIGLRFDGTTIPLTLAYFVLGALALLVVLITERGKLFEQPSARATA